MDMVGGVPRWVTNMWDHVPDWYCWLVDELGVALTGGT